MDNCVDNWFQLFSDEDVTSLTSFNCCKLNAARLWIAG